MSEQMKPNVVQSKVLNDEIDLLELLRTLLKYKKSIIFTSLGAALIAAAISMSLPNIYQAEILLAPVSAEGAKGGGLASALGGLGGLASMAGISIGGGGSAEENLAVLKSREFLWTFVQEKKLMPILFEDEWDKTANKWIEADPKKQPGQMDAHRLLLNEVMSVSRDKNTELVSVAFSLKDAELAADLANSLIERLNLYLAKEAIARSERNLQYLNKELIGTQVEEMRKILFELISNERKKIMMANTQKDFAFKVLDSAVPPDVKVKPKRGVIVFLSGLAGFFFALLFVLLFESVLITNRIRSFVR
ncbi:MAG: Wzz/FepE/Etk N-terminal domain-containing protein [Sideroxydans sp.]|nr:Wzz/FepE/Etk N-terminal domain-containing protein [Sideroxydans sp.]